MAIVLWPHSGPELGGGGERRASDMIRDNIVYGLKRLSYYYILSLPAIRSFAYTLYVHCRRSSSCSDCLSVSYSVSPPHPQFSPYCWLLKQNSFNSLRNFVKNSLYFLSV